jgi:hypothetical protein
LLLSSGLKCKPTIKRARRRLWTSAVLQKAVVRKSDPVQISKSLNTELKFVTKWFSDSPMFNFFLKHVSTKQQ